MPEAYRAEPSHVLIERPCCPKCNHDRMMLARIEPGSARSDLRTFECPMCGHLVTVVVEDPMKSTKPGWENSGLKAPD